MECGRRTNEGEKCVKCRKKVELFAFVTTRKDEPERGAPNTKGGSHHGRGGELRTYRRVGMDEGMEKVKDTKTRRANLRILSKVRNVNLAQGWDPGPEHPRATNLSGIFLPS